MKTILEVIGWKSDQEDTKTLVSLIDGEIDRYKNSGNSLGAGEWLVCRLPYSDEDARTLGTPFASSHSSFSGSARATMIVDVLGRCYPSLPRMSITAVSLCGSSDSMSARCSFDLSRMPNVKTRRMFPRFSNVRG